MPVSPVEAVRSVEATRATAAAMARSTAACRAARLPIVRIACNVYLQLRAGLGEQAGSQSAKTPPDQRPVRPAPLLGCLLVPCLEVSRRGDWHKQRGACLGQGSVLGIRQHSHAAIANFQVCASAPPTQHLTVKRLAWSRLRTAGAASPCACPYLTAL